MLVQHQLLPVSYTHLLENNFEAILNHWFDKSEELDFIVKQFSKNLHGNLFLENQLVDAIRNLEVYSRNFKNFKIPQRLSDIEEEQKRCLLNFINTNLLEEVRGKFRNRLKFNKKEPSLSERLKNLFDSIDELNQSKIFSKDVYKRQSSSSPKGLTRFQTPVGPDYQRILQLKMP